MKNRGWGLGTRGWGRKKREWGLGAGGWDRKAGVWAGVMLILAAAACPSGLARDEAGADAGTKLTVALHVYDYAQVEAGELARAQDEASTVLERIGIEAVWRRCPVPGEQLTPADDCRGTADRPALVLRVLPQAMAERMARGRDSLGFAQNGDTATPGFVASVFHHRVESLAVELGCARAVILGYAMAHEIGHLLLGTSSHSPQGIMRAQWTEKQLLSASAGRFGFFSQQGAKMRAEILARKGRMETNAQLSASSATPNKP